MSEIDGALEAAGLAYWNNTLEHWDRNSRERWNRGGRMKYAILAFLKHDSVREKFFRYGAVEKIIAELERGP